MPYETGSHTNYTVPLPDGHGCFAASSNGLASGNTRIEAISQGICEVIERHATSLWKRRQGFDEDRLDLTSIDDPISQEIIGKFESAGLLVAIWDITTDIKIAAFNCLIMPRNEGHVALCGSCGLRMPSGSSDRIAESFDRGCANSANCDIRIAR